MKQIKYKHRGSALISALFIMTLIAIAATAMSSRLQYDIYRTRMVITSDSLYLASQQVTFWAIAELASRKKTYFEKNQHIKLNDFPKKLEKSYPQLITKGELYDLQGLFNLNNLSDVRYFRTFVKLLENVLPQLNENERLALATDVRSWIGPYLVGRGHDELIQYYAKQNPPYQQGHELFQSVSELRLIRGVSAEIYQKLSPYLTALPEVTPINLNTAPKILIKSLGKGLNGGETNELFSAIHDNPMNNKAKVNQLLQKFGITPNITAFQSQYFMSKAFISSNEQQLTVYAILNRNAGKEDKLKISLVRESLNTL